MAVDQHYENFPVASLLLPRSIRAHVVAIYRFARHADDLADEGEASPAARLAALDHLDQAIVALFQRKHVDTPTVSALSSLRDASIPHIDENPFRSLLSAFRQDVTVHRYETFTELLDYCRRSANPVGRLMLALVGTTSPAALTASDCICTSLQLVNFWQDALPDARMGRLYVPLEDFKARSLVVEGFPSHPMHRELMRYQCERARALMRSGLPLLGMLRGRFRFEIALTVAGGLHILEKIAQQEFDVRIRPRLRWYDAPRLMFLTMRALHEGNRCTL